jgi:tetratricopeptide (TPR) repeat protein
MIKFLGILGFAFAVFLMVLAGATATHWKGWLSVKPAQNVKQASASEPALLVDLNRQAAALMGAPRNDTSTATKITAVIAAIQQGDFDSAETAVKESLQQSRLQNGYFRPFGKFIDRILQAGDEAFLHQLNIWVDSYTRQHKNPAIPYLLRALYHHKTAWRIRGEKFASDTQSERLDAFHTHSALAAADIVKAIRWDEENPYSAYLWLEIMSGNGNTPEMEAAFRQSIRKFPDYYPLYRVRLRTLSPKWGGSPKAMYAFAKAYAGQSETYSPLKLLYVQLYAHLVDTTWIACNDEKTDALAECMASMMDRLVTQDLLKNTYAALQLYPHADKFEFTREVGRLVTDLIRTRGAERYAGFVLQLAADSTGSNIQLSAKETPDNNFMIDYLAGYVWFRKDHYDNAEKLFNRALADLSHFPFPDEEERDMAKAELYDKLAGVYNGTRDYEKVVIYQTAAEALDEIVRPGWSHMKCHALYRLKLYDAAIKDCTSQFENGGTIETVYWRAKAHHEVGANEKALQDFRLVAESDHDFRTSAAIELSVIYAKSNDMPHMLEVLNTYDFLYDEAREDKKDIAIAYNNRCYAQMQLGNLQAALKDCTASLRFDSLPDAFQKQQELLKRLKAKEVGV